MKIKVAINASYGGFGLDELDFIKQFASPDFETRSDPRLIEFIEENANSVEDIILVEMPADATDCMIIEYDGYETLYYVLNGKIYAAEEFEEDDEDDT